MIIKYPKRKQSGLHLLQRLGPPPRSPSGRPALRAALSGWPRAGGVRGPAGCGLALSSAPTTVWWSVFFFSFLFLCPLF